MAGLEIRIDAAQRVGFSIADVDAGAEAEIREVLDEVVHSWRTILAAVWPRDTGISFMMWDSRVVGLTFLATNSVDYAEWVRLPGEDVGSAGDLVRAEAEQLVDDAGSEIRLIVEGARRRRAMGVARDGTALQRRARLAAEVERATQAPRALAAVFAAQGARSRQQLRFQRATLRGGRARLIGQLGQSEAFVPDFDQSTTTRQQFRQRLRQARRRAR